MTQSGCWFMCAAMALVLGCADGRPPTYPVSGVVQFEDGQPVTSGVVEFESLPDQTIAKGRIGAKGEFTLSTFADGDGAVEGNHRAIVVQQIFLDAATAEHRRHMAVMDDRYADYQRSGLEFTVEPEGKNFFRIVVKKASDKGA
jgi:hypothetical protein